MGCSPPGSSVLGTFQARILEWIAISSYRPNPGIEPASPESPALWADYLPLSHQEAREAQRPQTASESLLHLAVSQYRQV